MHGQTFQGEVRGMVTDHSGAAVPGAIVTLVAEGISEKRMIPSMYDAEGTGGGRFNMFLPSGTNALHWYQWMNDMIANDLFANAAGIPKIPQMWKNYGGTFGGLVMVPKLYCGKNRMFFGIGAEAYRQNQTSSTSLSVTTAVERSGDFSQSKYTSGTLQTIYDPSTTSISHSGA
jgi:hypothetical protein